MEQKDGGPAFPCGKKGCADQAVRQQGRQRLCAMHYRFGQMRVRAKRDGKKVPSHEELHGMLGASLKCPDCDTHMNWLSNNGQATVVSLQHYRDGSMALVCRSCNTRHASMPGDSFRRMPKDHKRCPGCQCIKPESEFTVDRGRTGPLKRKSHCRTCSDAAVYQWKESNRERYNEYQRAYRAKRKAEGNPVRRAA